MSKRINKDGTLNYFEIIRQQIEKIDLFIHSIMIVVLTIGIYTICLKEFSFVQIIFKSTTLLLLSSIYYLMYFRTVFFVYKRDFYEKDLKKMKSKKSYKNLKNNMNKLNNSVFMPNK
jgi:hypothetical protein